MSQTPEEIRAEIDRTRSSVSSDVDALAEKVSPSGIVGRESERVKSKVNDVRERIFGAPDDSGDGGAVGDAANRVGDAANRAGEQVKQQTDRAVQKAKGNPLAVGLIAFGVGALIATLIPATDAEKDAAVKVKDGAQPLVDQAKDVAKEMGENLKEPAQEAAQSVKETAQGAGEHIKGDAQGAADSVKGDAQGAADRVKGDADRARQNVQGEAQR